MDVIFHSTNGDRVHSVVLQDSRHVGPQFRLELLADTPQPFFGTEDDVHMIANVRA